MVITDPLHHPVTAHLSTATSISGYERDAVLAALHAGVVPAVGQRHIQVRRVPSSRPSWATSGG